MLYPGRELFSHSQVNVRVYVHIPETGEIDRSEGAQYFSDRFTKLHSSQDKLQESKMRTTW